MTLKHRGFKAWISFEDSMEAVEEYMACQDPKDEKIYTCWIESEAGKRFSVYWESVEKSSCRGVVFVDGVETDRNTASDNMIGTSKGVRTMTGDIRPYIFSNVSLTDDDSYLDVKQSINTDDLGSTTIKIFLGRVVRDGRKYRHKKQEALLYDGPIHESSKKIWGHRVTLGEIIPSGLPRRKNKSRYTKSGWVYDDPKTPHVIFRFRYRPREFLKARGIIPTPTVIENTFQIRVGDNHDNTAGGGNKPARERSPTGHLEKRERSQRPCSEVNSPPVFFQTPRPLKQDEDLIVLGYSQRDRKRRRAKQDKDSEGSQVKRLKQEAMDPVEAEDGMCLSMDCSGVIDLTMDD